MCLKESFKTPDNKCTNQFKSISRDKREIMNKSKGKAPPIGRYNIKYESVDKHTRNLSFKATTGRDDSFILNKTQDKTPNKEFERPWFSPMKYRNTIGSSNTDLKEVFNSTKMAHFNNKLNHSSSFNNSEKKNILNSSFGQHQWNKSKYPDIDAVQWPPVVDKVHTSVKQGVTYDKQIKRPDILKKSLSANENRFELIDKKPKVLSQYRRSPSQDFSILEPRNRTKLNFKFESHNFFYDVKTNLPKKRLSIGHISMDKQLNRKEGIRQKIQESSKTANLDKAEMRQSKRHKAINYVNMNKMNPRDDKMQNTGEWYKNCLYENNKEHQAKIQNTKRKLKY